MSREDLKIVVIGAGMAGLLSAIRLKRAGYTQVTIIEKGASIGGTWRDNTYPGLICDTPSHSYTYSFAPHAEWSSYLAPGREILEYLEKNTREYDLYAQINFNQEVRHCHFDGRQWQISTSTGAHLHADIVICATGVLHHPYLPEIKGRDRFLGSVFHSSQWDHSHDLSTKRVAVIGNGSTGVQLVSELVHQAKHVHHFQRTPQWIMPVENAPYTEEQKRAFRNNPELLHRMQNDPELSARIDAFSAAIVNPSGPEMQMIQDAVAANLDMSVSDPALKQQLTPDYQAACKRLIFSPDYYQAIQAPNAQLVRTQIREFEPEGIRTTDGALHTCDVIVLATGFKAHQFMRPMRITGENQIDLDQLWQHKPAAYLSVALPTFPNLFMLNGPNGPVGNFSLTEIAEAQQVYIETILARIAAGDFSHIAVKQSAYEAFNQRLTSAAKTTVFGSGCQSWYLDKDGIPATWPWTRTHFREVMAAPLWADFDTWTVGS